MKVPNNPLALISSFYNYVIPSVKLHLDRWQTKAHEIPDPELQKQAVISIETKRFHCEWGAIYSLLAKDNRDEIIEFIVAYQTLLDYLDNLCDRSTSLNPKDFEMLHKSVFHALTPNAENIHNSSYYHFRKEQEDGGYLQELVKTCQTILQGLPSYSKISSFLNELATHYCNLQVYKHIEVEKRVPCLKSFFTPDQNDFPNMKWYEMSACAGSSLGIFCLMVYASDENCPEELFEEVKISYFPWMQGLHILLDYLIDQEEDRREGDLNFCFYYQSDSEMKHRLTHFVKKAEQGIKQLPNYNFHHMIHQALLGVYLGDQKVGKQKNVQKMASHLLSLGGVSAIFFFINASLLNRFRQYKHKIDNLLKSGLMLNSHQTKVT